MNSLKPLAQFLINLRIHRKEAMSAFLNSDKSRGSFKVAIQEARKRANQMRQEFKVSDKQMNKKFTI